MTLLTQKAYAKRRRVTPQYVNKLVAKGVIRLVQGKVNPGQADRALQAQRRIGNLPRRKKKKGANAHGGGRPARSSAGKAAAAGTSATRSLTASRADREKWLAKQAELDYQRASGRLLPAGEVREAWSKAFARLRTAFRRLPRALADPLAKMASAPEVEARLLEEIDRHLAELAADPLGAIAAAAPPEGEGPLQTSAGAVPSTQYPVPGKAAPAAEGATA